jgi:hypothetical protein
LVKLFGNRSKNNIDIQSRIKSTINEFTEVFTTPSLQAIANNGWSDLGTHCQAKTEITFLVFPVIHNEPIRRLMSSSVFLQAFELSFTTEDTIFNIIFRQRKRLSFCDLLLVGGSGLGDHLWFSYVRGNRGLLCGVFYLVGMCAS